MLTVKNYHAVKVSFKNNGHPHTILTSQRHPHNMKILPYDHTCFGCVEQAAKWMDENGFKVVGQTELPGNKTILLTENFNRL